MIRAGQYWVPPGSSRGNLRGTSSFRRTALGTVGSLGFFFLLFSPGGLPLLPCGTAAEPEQRTDAPYSPKGLFLATSASLKPDWPSQFLPPISAKLATRTHLALALGSVLAEGYMAAQAEDPQHTRNLNKDLLQIAKPLGLHTELLERSKSLTESAEKRAWSTVGRELEGTEADVLRILRQNKDDELILLVRIGAWVRATEAVSQLIASHYNRNAADLLHHGEMAGSFSSSVESLSPQTREDPLVAAIYPRLTDLSRLLQGPKETPPTEEEIKAYAQTARSVLHDILSKP